MQPVNTPETVTEPTGKQRADETQQVAENRDGVGNDPSDYPAGQANGHPGSDGNQVSAVHTVRAAEETNVDVLEPDVAVDYTSTNDLQGINDRTLRMDVKKLDNVQSGWQYRKRSSSEEDQQIPAPERSRPGRHSSR